MSMKCRCGSNDKLVLKDGKVINTKDGNPHICIGETQPKDFSSDEYLKKKQNEIMLESSKKNKDEPESKITKYTREHNLILEEMEHVLIDEDPKLKTNVQKLGMKLKIIYQGMPEDIKKCDQ